MVGYLRAFRTEFLASLGAPLVALISLVGGIAEALLRHDWLGIAVPAVAITVCLLLTARNVSKSDVNRANDIIWVPHKRRSRFDTVSYVALGAVSLACFVWLFLRPGVTQVPTLTGEEIGTRLVNQRIVLFANIHFKNEGTTSGYATHYMAWHIEPGDAITKSKTVNSEMDKRILGYASRKNSIKTPIAPGEGQWFTIIGPVLTREDSNKFFAGDPTAATVFFGARIYFTDKNGTSVLPVCFFNQGLPGQNFLCPKASD